MASQNFQFQSYKYGLSEKRYWLLKTLKLPNLKFASTGYAALLLCNKLFWHDGSHFGDWKILRLSWNLLAEQHEKLLEGMLKEGWGYREIPDSSSKYTSMDKSSV